MLMEEVGVGKKNVRTFQAGEVADVKAHVYERAFDISEVW